MKNFGKMIFGAAMIASFASCSNETDFGHGKVEEGIPTYARITLDVNSAGSRSAASRSASLDGEKEINDVRILVFDRSGILETIKDLSGVTAGSPVSQTIKTTTGDKTIYAIANPTTEIQTVKEGATLASLEKLEVEAVKQAEDPDYSCTVSIAAKSKFLMTGSTKATFVKTEEGPANSFTVNVTRLASKAAVKLPASSANSESGFVKDDATAVSFSDTKFQLVQMNKKSVIKADPYSPKGADADQTPSGSPLVFEHLTVWNAALKNKDWVTGLGDSENFDSGLSFDGGKFAYTSENINQTPKVGNITFAMVQVKMTPTTWSSNDGVEDAHLYVVVKYKTAGDKTFSNIAEYVGIYKDKDTATAEMNKLDDSDKCQVVKYENRLAYYRLNLRDAAREEQNGNKYDLKRNSYYRITIDGIKNPGTNNPEDLIPADPTDPIENDINIEATITVADWVDINMNEPLG